MPSEYDSLLEEAPQQSEYDTLLEPEPQQSSIAGNIGRAAWETVKSFVPTSLEQAKDFAVSMAPTLAIPRQTYNTLSAIVNGEGVLPAATHGIPVAQRIPEIAAAEKTAPFSQERFQAGFGTLADVAMLAGIGHGIAKGVPKTLTEVYKGVEEPIAPEPSVVEPMPAVEPVAAEPKQVEFYHASDADLPTSFEVKNNPSSRTSRTLSEEYGVPASDVGLFASDAPEIAAPYGSKMYKITADQQPIMLDNGKYIFPEGTKVKSTPVPEVGNVWYQGVSKEGSTPWVTHDINIAKSYAARRGEGAKINVYTPEQVGETAFADPEGNLISPQEYAKHNWSTTLQTGGQPLPKPSQTLTAEGLPVPEAVAPVTAEPIQKTAEVLGKQEPVAPTTAAGTGEVPAFKLEETTPRPEPPELTTFSVESPTDVFGTEHTPIASFLMENVGGLVSKSGAKKAGKLKGNEALFDDDIKLSHPTHNKVFNPSGEMPDVAAQALYDAGLISDPSPTTMRKALSDESRSARSSVSAQKGEIADIKKQAGQVKDFSQAQREGWKKGDPLVQVRDLQVGDTVTVKGESLKVTDIDPDTFDVTLEDGKKYGVQTVKDNTVIYGQHEATLPAPKLLAGETQGDLISSTPKEDFALVGEKGTDFGARQSAAEQATAERAQSEKGQLELSETPTAQEVAPSEEVADTAFIEGGKTTPVPETPVSTTAPLPQKPSKIGQSIEAKAVESKLTKGFAETAGYDPLTIKDQSNRATALVKDDLPLARSVVRGEAPLPEGLRGTSVITAMEEHLLKNPDPKLAYELANSPLTSATSAYAQEMRLMRERVPDSVSAKFQEIREARKAGAELRGETTQKVTADITKEVVKRASKRPTWEAFVREIVCR